MAVELSFDCDAGASIFHAILGGKYGGETIPAGTMDECSYCGRIVTWRLVTTSGEPALWDWHHFKELVVQEWP